MYVFTLCLLSILLTQLLNDMLSAGNIYVCIDGLYPAMFCLIRENRAWLYLIFLGLLLGAAHPVLSVYEPLTFFIGTYVLVALLSKNINKNYPYDLILILIINSTWFLTLAVKGYAFGNIGRVIIDGVASQILAVALGFILLIEARRYQEHCEPLH